MTYVVEVTLGGCIAWEGHKFGVRITPAMGIALVRPLERFYWSSVNLLRPRR
jgi:hypothetical protein